MDKQFVNNLFDVKGKVVLITGATGALGKAISFGYGFAGMKVFVTGRSDDKCKAVCTELEAQGIECGYSIGDPAVEADVIKVVKDVTSKFGEINVLVTAAGYNHPQPIIEQELSEWKKIMDSDVQGTWLYCKYVGKQMIDQGKGGKVILALLLVQKWVWLVTLVTALQKLVLTLWLRLLHVNGQLNTKLMLIQLTQQYSDQT